MRFFAASIRTLNLWIDRPGVKAPGLSLRLRRTLNSRPHNSCNNRHCTVVESYGFREMWRGLVMTPVHVQQMASSWKLTFGQHLGGRGRRPSPPPRTNIESSPFGDLHWGVAFSLHGDESTIFYLLIVKKNSFMLNYARLIVIENTLSVYLIASYFIRTRCSV